MPKDSDIKRRMGRVQGIIYQLDMNDVSLDEGKELYKEGKRLIDEIRNRLDENEGEILEIE
jgi:exodeoxyribonuclease VII small subunit